MLLYLQRSPAATGFFSVGAFFYPDLMTPLGCEIRLGKNLKGIALAFVIRNRRDPLFQISKRLQTGKQPGLGNLSCFRVEGHRG